MFAVLRLRASRPLLVALVAAVTLPVLTVPGVATAEAPSSATETVVGQLVQAWPEYKSRDEAADRGAEGPLSFVRMASGDSVRVETVDVEDVPVGATVEVTIGRTIPDDAATEDGYEKARDVLDTEVLAPPPVAPATTAPAVTPVNHPVSVVMVVPAGGTRDSATLDQVVGLVNGPVAEYWSEQTDGSVNLGVTGQRDWVDLSVGCADPYALWAAAARAVGFTRGSKKHLLVYVSSRPGNLSGCSDGLGEVGWDQNTGGYSYVRYPMSSMIAHELGHNLGLGHSSLLQCDGATNSGDCAVTPYLDLYDVMGASWGQMGSLNLANGHSLQSLQSMTYGINWNPEYAHDVTLSAVSGRTGTRDIQLRDGGPGTYWLEYRPASARDGWLGTSANQFGLQPGVLLRMQGDDDDASLLIDATPSTESAWDDDLDVALPLNSPVRIEGWRGAGVFDITVTGMTAASATLRIVPRSAVTLAYEASGGPTGPMGAVTTMSEQLCGSVGGQEFCHRRFANGEVVWTPEVEGGAHLIHGPIHAAWQAGGPYSTFGFPTTDTTCGLANGGCRQHFVNSNLYWSSTTGAVAVAGVLRTAYESIGEESGVIGYPTAAPVCGTSGGCRQQFQGGLLATSPATGTRLVDGDIAAAWAAQGHEAGPLGYPLTGRICGMKDGGCGQVFQGGRIYATPATGAHAMTGPIHTAWIRQGYEVGPLGYPTGDQVCGLAGGGCKQAFQGGTLYAHPTAGTHPVSGARATVWTAAGGEGGPLGYPLTGLICGMKDGGCGQVFQGGRIYATPATGAHAMTGPIHTAWIRQGYEVGPLGYPTGDQVCGLAGGGCKQAFQGGTLYAHPAAGTHPVAGDMATTWVAQGGEGGPLGYPLTGLICGMKDGGCGQVFQGGRIYATPATGAHAFTGVIQTAWIKQGYEVGPLGYPTGDQVCGLAGGGCKQAFQGGTLYAHPTAGTHPVSGARATVWTAAGGEGGPLGYPLTGLICGMKDGGCGQVFQGGRIYATPATGVHAVAGDYQTVWAAQGYEAGKLGYPLTGLICGMKDGGCGQVFQGGRIYATPATGAHAMTGPIHTAWIRQGYEVGPLGYPTGDQVCGLAGGGCKQAFQGGTLYAHPAAGTHPVAGDMATTWVAQGGEGGPLGYPLTGLICGMKDGGCGQVFQGGRIYATPATGAHAFTGVIQTAWIKQGYEVGPLGYPTGDQVCGLAGGGCKQAFQGGTLYAHPTAGTHPVSGARATVWTAAGGEGGPLGYPLTGLICGMKDGGCGQVFQGGRIYATPATGAHAMTGPIHTAWINQGYEVGPLGYPTSDTYAVTGGTAQDFQGGKLTLDSATGQVTRT